MNILGLSINRRTFFVLIGIGLYVLMLMVLASAEKIREKTFENLFSAFGICRELREKLFMIKVK